jgi:hypothetical protein
MNRTSLATLTLRIAALYLWLQAILSCTSLLIFLAIARQEPRFALDIGMFAGVATEGIVGTLLWIASRKWADRMLGVEGAGPVRAQEIGTLAFRLVGVWMLVNFVREAGEFVTVDSAQAGAILAARVAAPTVKLVLGLALLLGGAGMARRWFPDAESPRATPIALQPIAFSVLGIVVLSNALPVLVSSLGSHGDWYESDGGHVSSGGESTARLVAAILRVAIGLWLFFGFGSLVRFWRWIQTAGLDRQSVPRA